jgi:hypothetical protein
MDQSQAGSAPMISGLAPGRPSTIKTACADAPRVSRMEAMGGAAGAFESTVWCMRMEPGNAHASAETIPAGWSVPLSGPAGVPGRIRAIANLCCSSSPLGKGQTLSLQTADRRPCSAGRPMGPNVPRTSAWSTGSGSFSTSGCSHDRSHASCTPGSIGNKGAACAVMDGALFRVERPPDQAQSSGHRLIRPVRCTADLAFARAAIQRARSDVRAAQADPLRAWRGARWC